jgi:hypothetical protein
MSDRTCDEMAEDNQPKYNLHDRVLIEMGSGRYKPAAIVSGPVKNAQTFHNNYYYEVSYLIFGCIAKCEWISEYSIKGVI